MLERVFLAILLLTHVAACDFSFGITGRSGSESDDYIAEPLGDRFKKYAKVLEASNATIEAIQERDAENLYHNIAGELMKELVTYGDLEALIESIHDGAGQLTDYKPMQWHFFGGSENGIDLIYSVKIAEHQAGMVNYLLVFEGGIDRPKLYGIFLKDREGPLIPGHF
ncbi:MAG: hypothetical protein P1U64_05735 [Alcanivoracaceae bacterium]|nr:hypothetical protein [Alcanivoracaceae bacterium]